MSGEVGILNVGCGDTKIVFDPENPQDMIRAARIVKDMLRRGYALLIEVKHEGGPSTYRRAADFDEATCEYIIADFDPTVAKTEDQHEEAQEAASEELVEAGAETPAPQRRPHGTGRTRKTRVPATGVKAVAVARTAGG